MASHADACSRQSAIDGLAATQLSGCFGAEVSGLDLRRPLTPSARDAISDFLSRYRVLVFRDQHGVTPKQLLDFATHFGAPETAPHPSWKHVDDLPGVKEIWTSDVDTGFDPKNTWHTDGSTRKNTRFISVLQGIELPEYGRDTLFSDMVTAYEMLSEAMKTFLDGLVAEHSWGAQKPDEPSVYHPLVLEDPGSGAKALYVNHTYTRSISNLRSDESKALLDFLFDQARIPELQLRVTWRPGTIVMWNNELTQHALIRDRPYRRIMHRVMVS